MATSGVVAVWEWLNEYGRWRPYAPHVCAFNEKHLGQQGQIYLGHVDPVLGHYLLDLTSMQQIRHSTGTVRAVRRKLYAASSPAGSGQSWQWSGDQAGQWHPYDMETICVLEDAFSQGYPSVDLSKTPCKLPYTVDFKNMHQLRNETGFVRAVRRTQTNLQYPIANLTGNPLPGNTTSGNTMTSPASAVNGNLPGSGSGTAVGHGGSSAFNSVHSNLAGSVYDYSSSSQPQKSGAAAKKKAHSGVSQTFNGSPKKYTRLAARNMAAANQQQQLQQQQQQPNSLPVLLSAGLNFNNFYGSLTPGFSSGFCPATPPANVAPPQTITAGTSRTLGSLLSPAMTSMTSMLVSPAVPVMITSPPSTVTTPGPFGELVDTQSTKELLQADEVLKKYVYIVSNPPKDDDCCICYDKLTEGSDYGPGEDVDHTVYKLNRCDHSFHRSCLNAMYDSGTKDGSIQCPTCKTIYGKKHGNRPSGRMQYTTLPQSLPDHPDCGTIRIDYHITPGIQGPEHPNPGRPYATRGFPRHGYLPDCERGRKLLRLLLIAWQRRLTFTIGTSVTTGERDTVVWNEIHHKTEFGSNHSGHGYPDPKYLDNLTQELAAQGVTEDDL